MPAPTPQTPSEARSAYSQIQRGGDIPVSGLRMTVPERPKGMCMNFNPIYGEKCVLGPKMRFGLQNAPWRKGGKVSTPLLRPL